MSKHRLIFTLAVLLSGCAMPEAPPADAGRLIPNGTWTVRADGQTGADCITLGGDRVTQFFPACGGADTLVSSQAIIMEGDVLVIEFTAFPWASQFVQGRIYRATPQTDDLYIVEITDPGGTFNITGRLERQTPMDGNGNEP